MNEISTGATEAQSPPHRESARVDRLAAELSATRRRLDQALATARMAYWDWDPVNDRVIASKSMDVLFGLREGERFGMNHLGFELLHPEDRDRHRELMHTSGQRGKGWHTEYRIVRPRDGSVLWLEERATATNDAVSGMRYITAFVWDISERKRIADTVVDIQRRAQDERERQLRRERHRREAAEAFMAVMSHELRTPVTSIHGNAALLARHLGRPNAAELVTDIQDESDRLMRIIDDLMVLSGVDRGLLHLSPEPVLVQHLARGLLDDLRRRFPGVEFRVDLPADLSAVVADATALRQVLYNLLTNAAKYAGQAGPVVIRGREVRAEVEIAVLDDGPGLGENPSALFELFYRDPDVAGQTSGTGIGLYVVRELIVAMGTWIEAATRDGGGAEFRFRLPAVTDMEA